MPAFKSRKWHHFTFLYVRPTAQVNLEYLQVDSHSFTTDDENALTTLFGVRLCTANLPRFLLCFSAWRSLRRIACLMRCPSGRYLRVYSRNI